jgi:hypothetical protein
MPSEIREKPLPTPHPDQPRTGAGPSEGVHRRDEEMEAPREADSGEIAYDSVTDDLNRALAEPISEPDPVLKSMDPSGTKKPSSRIDLAIFSLLGKKRNQPRTSEIFGDIRPPSDEIRPRGTGWWRSLSRLVKGPRGWFARSPRGAPEAIHAPHLTGETHRVDAGSHYDDNGHSSRGMWLSLLLLSYASAVTMGLAWVLLTGRTLHPVQREGQDAKRAADEPGSKSREPVSNTALPAIPAENIARIGQAIRMGDVEVTPVSVELAPVELVRTIEPADYHLDEVSSLILRLKLTNVSKEHELKPLVRSLIRDGSSPADRSFITTPDGGKIELYPLAEESEWVISGQEFRALKPGESVTTLVASKPVTEDLLRDEMTWRVRLRIGPYRTDMLGVRFRKGELSE